MTLIRYKLYNGSNRYKLKSPSFIGKGSFVFGVAPSLVEDTSAHVDVTCFDGGDGSITVSASGGTAPYQYSIDGVNWQSSPTFGNLFVTAPVTEDTDQYGGIVTCTKTIHVKDANGFKASVDVQLKSPVELEWLNMPNDIYAFCDPAQTYATVIFDYIIPSTTANGYVSLPIGGLSPNNYYNYSINQDGSLPKQQISFYAVNDCNEEAADSFYITVLPLYYPNTTQDYDGNWYDAVVIGNQVWLAQNLRTTHYADGTAIPAGGSNSSDTAPYYYDYSTSNIPLNMRGYLYNWPAVMNGASSSNTNPSGVQGIAPTGWHVPSNSEWTQLTNYVNNQSVYRYNDENNKIAKALAYNDYWNDDDTAGNVGNDQSLNNATMFGAVAAGGVFAMFPSSKGVNASFWQSTESGTANAGTLFIQYNNNITVDFTRGKKQGHSVRCICDLSPLDFTAWYYGQYGSYNHQLPTE